MASSASCKLTLGGVYLALCNAREITLWRKTTAFKHAYTIAVPSTVSIASASLSPCGQVLAVTIYALLSRPVLVLYSSNNAQLLLRIELPHSLSHNTHSPVWVPSAQPYTLIVPLDDPVLAVFEFCEGYARIRRKLCINLRTQFGPLRRISVVPLSQDTHAVAVIYANVIELYSISNAQSLFASYGAHVHAIVSLLRTGSSHCALALVEFVDSDTSQPRMPPMAAEVGDPGISPANTQDHPLVLSWALLGDRGCWELAAVPDVQGRAVVDCFTFETDMCRVLLLTDTGVFIGLDPFSTSGPLFQCQVPPSCWTAAKQGRLGDSRFACAPLAGMVSLVHIRDEKRSPDESTVCVHILDIKTNEDSPLCTPFGQTKPREPCEPMQSQATLDLIDSNISQPIQGLPLSNRSVEIPLRLRISRSQGEWCSTQAAAAAAALHWEGATATRRAQNAASARHGRELSSDGSPHKSYVQQSDERQMNSQCLLSVPLCLPARASRPLGDITNLGLNLTISRRQRHCLKHSRTRSQQLSLATRAAVAPAIPLRLNVKPLRRSNRMS